MRRATASFNDSIGSFDRNVMPQARRLEELPGVVPTQDALPGHIDIEIRESAYGVEAVDEDSASPQEDKQEDE